MRVKEVINLLTSNFFSRASKKVIFLVVRPSSRFSALEFYCIPKARTDYMCFIKVIILLNITFCIVYLYRAKAYLSLLTMQLYLWFGLSVCLTIQLYLCFGLSVGRSVKRLCRKIVFFILYLSNSLLSLVIYLMFLLLLMYKSSLQ